MTVPAKQVPCPNATLGLHMEGGLGSQIPRVLRYQELFGASGWVSIHQSLRIRVRTLHGGRTPAVHKGGWGPLVSGADPDRARRKRKPPDHGGCSSALPIRPGISDFSSWKYRYIPAIRSLTPLEDVDRPKALPNPHAGVHHACLSSCLSSSIQTQSCQRFGDLPSSVAHTRSVFQVRGRTGYPDVSLATSSPSRHIKNDGNSSRSIAQKLSPQVQLEPIKS